MANAEKNAGIVFLLDESTLQQTAKESVNALRLTTVSGLPSSIVTTIAPLSMMQPRNAEIFLAKY